MGKSQRDKGARWEREVASRLRQIYGDKQVRRSRQAEGALDSDVVCPDWWVECGHGKRMNAQQKLAQAVRDCALSGQRKIPVAVVKVDRQQPVVCMLMEDWLEIASTRARARQDHEAHQERTVSSGGEEGTQCAETGASE